MTSDKCPLNFGYIWLHLVTYALHSLLVGRRLIHLLTLYWWLLTIFDFWLLRGCTIKRCVKKICLTSVYCKNFLRTSVDVLKCKLELVAVSPKHNTLIYSTAETEDVSVGWIFTPIGLANYIDVICADS